MRRTCDEFRSLMERSIFESLTAEERGLLDGHLEGCTGCRGYLDELKGDDLRMREYAALFEDDIADVRGAVTVSLQCRGGNGMPKKTLSENARVKRYFTGWRAAAAIAAAIAVLILIGFRSGLFEPSTPAFATVLEKIGKAEDVSYRTTYRVEGMEPFSTLDMINSRGCSRKEHTFGAVVIHVPYEGKQLTLHHGSRRATLLYRRDASNREGLVNYLEWIKTLHKNRAVFGGRGAVNGRETNLFVNDEDPYYQIRVWTALDTDLPVRAEFVSTPNPKSTVIVPTLTLYKKSFGSPSTESRAISYSAPGGITIPATVVMDDFVWNRGFEESLFSLEPPRGYILEEDTLDVTDSGEEGLVRALELWASMSGGAFPGDINDLGHQERAVPLLIAAYDGDDDPEREFDAAMKAANVLLKGCLFAQEMKVAGFWQYRGKGVTMGDARTPVCWWRAEGADDFSILYGDLRVEGIAEEELPAR
jgi:hypothetical protein